MGQLAQPGFLSFQHSHSYTEVTSLHMQTKYDTQEGLMEINRLLVEAANKENFDISSIISRPGKSVSIEHLASLIQLFRLFCCLL